MQNFRAVLDGTHPYVGQMRGTVLLIQTADQGNALTIQLMRAGAVLDTVSNMGPAAKLIPVGGFDSFTINGTAGTVQGVVTAGDIDIQLSQVGTLITNGDAQAVPIRPATGQHIPVDVMSGVINMTATNVGINNDAAHPVPVSLVSEPGAPIPVTLTGSTDATPIPVTPVQGTAVSEVAPVAVPAFTGGTPNQVHIVTAGARRALRIANPPGAAGMLYVGGAGITPTNAVIVLSPGDVWSETDAPGADWYATSDTGTSANVQVIV